MTYVLTLLLLIVIGFAGYVRINPVPEARFTARPGPSEVGIHKTASGVKVVVPLTDLPEDALSKLTQIILSSPRTTQRGTEPAAFVTRSALWRFPDVAVVWQDGDALHIHSALVYGQSDLGVNSARVSTWIDALR